MLHDLREAIQKDTFWFEMTNGTLLSVWALVLAIPTKPSPCDGILATTWVWSLLSSSLAGLAIAGLITGWRRLRLLALLGGVFLWGTVGAALVFGGLGAAGGWFYATFAGLCAVTYMVRWRGG